jgi:hypothetical protein
LHVLFTLTCPLQRASALSRTTSVSMADLAAIQQSIQREFKKTTRTKPLFLETRGSVWSSTKLPIAFFALYALVIYALNNAGLGEQEAIEASIGLKLTIYT